MDEEKNNNDFNPNYIYINNESNNQIILENITFNIFDDKVDDIV
tara:strand:- start:355 stop:486 length:132 start_codon:yes stop_codon:yes gene_type:complete